MKEGALEALDGAQMGRGPAADSAVRGVADNRVPDRAQVHANLMSAPRMNRDLRERHRRVEMLGTNDPRNRLAAAPRPCRCPC